MKKLFLTALMLLLVCVIFAEGLNEFAAALKDADNAEVKVVYQIIKEHAIKKWNDDHSMIIYEINKQCEAYFQIFKGAPDVDILAKAILKWSYEGYLQHNLTATKNGKPGQLHCDWSMVLYEYRKQTEAKNKY